MGEMSSIRFFTGGVNDEQVDSLLLLAVPDGETTRPVDRFLDRIARPDGKDWFDDGARKHLGLTPSPEDALIRRQPGMDGLCALKTRTKELGAQRGDTCLISVGGYFISLALAFGRHGLRITGQPASKCHEVFQDLENGLWDPWCGEFRVARQRIEAGDWNDQETDES
jgi:hypothetical protein